MNNLQNYANIFDGITPWVGQVPKGYLVDFLGTLTDVSFRTMFGVNPADAAGRYQETRLPRLKMVKAGSRRSTGSSPHVMHATILLWRRSAPAMARRRSEATAHSNSSIRCPANSLRSSLNRKTTSGRAAICAITASIRTISGWSRSQLARPMIPFYFPSDLLAPARRIAFPLTA